MPMRHGLILILVLNLLACAVPGVRVDPVVDAGRPYRLDGFSILAPGEHWYVVDHQPSRIGFVRYGRSWDDSWGAEAQFLAIPFVYRDGEDFFARLARRRDGFRGDPRFELLETRQVRERFRQMECLASRLAARDRGAINRGASLYLLLQVVSLSCLHPDVHSHMIELRFSHRGRRLLPWTALEAEARAYFRGLGLPPDSS